ncbi:MAG: hypothetical protein NWF08_06920 [Candidatus Bathyarchaeota archaeon]|nr:hypothetical protein [Candidatus Bathyarchaeota archaeon]
MSNSLKTGAISGLSAGIIKALAAIIIGVPLSFKLGLPYYWIPPPPTTPFSKIITNEFIINLIFGAIWGIIYSRAYRVIPGKGIMKGLIFGLFGYLIWHIRWVTLFISYGDLSQVTLQIIYGIIVWIPFGIALGIIFEYMRNRYQVPRKEPKIKQYNAIDGFFPGAFAGILGGVASFIANFASHDLAEYLVPGHVIDFSLFLSQFGTQIMQHLMWGVFLGLIYSKVYNLVPGKGIIKGLIYGLIGAYLINEVPTALFFIGYGNLLVAYMIIAIGGLQAIVYGLALGYLYKKPT